MRSKKKYTNATFTKRVDHEAGRHRTLRAMGEPSVCEDCGGALYAKRRWAAATSAADKRHKHSRLPQTTVCPACVCALSPQSPFDGVGRWYRDFSQATDGEVRDLLERAKSLHAALSHELAGVE